MMNPPVLQIRLAETASDLARCFPVLRELRPNLSPDTFLATMKRMREHGYHLVMGESAGGGHAALLAIAARDRGTVPLVFQALVYPMLDDCTGSGRDPAPGLGRIGWDGPSNRFGWAAFLGTAPGSADVPRAAVPARTVSLAGLAPAFIAVGGLDLFLHEDVDYALRLTDAGVPVQLLVTPGAFHGFDRAAPDATLSRQFIAAKLDALRRAFATGVGPAS